MYPSGVDIRAPVSASQAGVLSPEALAFVATLARRFEARRQELLGAREARQLELDAGVMPDFLAETAEVRAARWRVASIPADLEDRRVEITGPVDRKMIINALNSGADVFMADFEDANAPTWSNCVEGQVNLKDAVRRSITFEAPETGKRYELAERTATLFVRPRGWHLDEKHVLVDGAPVSASLFDFGLYFFHNARETLERSAGPYFYLPKLESHLEARLWNEVFVAAQELVGIPRGSIRATVLIENILAAFEMDEILWELREHSAGLNCGRWDYIFSAIRKFRRRSDWVLPDRAQVTMRAHMMRSYSLLVIKTCHARGIHAMGGMAAQIPIKGDPEANEAALAKVRADKEREAGDGHDGTWVAHPGLVSLAREAFDAHMSGANQIDRGREDVGVSASDLLTVPHGEITVDGVRTNFDVAIQYLASWLDGNGCVPIYNLMEDAATAEISRAQLWQWLHHPDTRLSDGRPISRELYDQLLQEALARIRSLVGQEAFDGGRFREASELVETLVMDETFTEFLTLPAYDRLE